MKNAKAFFILSVVLVLSSCANDPENKGSDCTLAVDSVPTPSTTMLWYPQTKHEADSSGQWNWVDAKGQRQGFWKLTGSMEKDNTYPPNATIEEGYYLDSQKKGWWKMYSPNGALNDSTYKYCETDSLNYVDAKHLNQGYWRITGAMEHDVKYSAEAVVREGVFVNGKRVGVWTYYTPEGKVDHYSTFTNDSIVTNAAIKFKTTECSWHYPEPKNGRDSY